MKPPKTKKSRKPIYLPLSLYNDLQQLKIVSNDSSPGGRIFPSERENEGARPENGQLEASAAVMPLDYHNWVNRNLKPVADKLGIRVNCQIMRRTFATLANDAGGDLKDIQTQMRHARSATTADIYVQPIPQSVRESIEALDKVLSDRARKPRIQEGGRPCPVKHCCDIAAISAPTLVLGTLKRPNSSMKSIICVPTPTLTR